MTVKLTPAKARVPLSVLASDSSGPYVGGSVCPAHLLCSDTASLEGDEDGLVSGTAHAVVEPSAGSVSPEVRRAVHERSCALLAGQGL